MQIILLAAGQSKRFNGIKQLANISGTALINCVLNNYIQVNTHDLKVVLGANAERIEKILPESISTLYVKDWEKGMGHNLAAAMATVEESVTHVLIGVADQVALTAGDLEQLLAQAAAYPTKIIAAEYRKKTGVPAIFPKGYFSALANLSGDTGAKPLLKEHRENVIALNIARAAIDIDTQEELATWLHNHSKH